LIATAGHAFADVIDGDWCEADGRHMSIRGPSIVTPGGKQVNGLYSRHSFSYTVPDSEAAAGTAIYMRLINPDTIDLWTGAQVAASAPAEVWSRCTPISALEMPHRA
jgi:hypothetical protein